jgi:fatty acid synthase
LLNNASISGSKGYIAWIDNWVTFMDNMLQMYIIGKDIRDLYISTNNQKLVINPALHASKLRDVTISGEIKTKRKSLHTIK